MGIWSKKWAAVAVLAVAPLSLGGCFILPGEFVSAMTVRQNGEFSFSYKGQIQLVGMANLLEDGFLNEASSAEFKPVCYSDSMETLPGNNDLKIEVDRDDVAASRNFAMVPAGYWTALAIQDSPEIADETAKAADDAAQAAADAATSAASWDLGERACTPDEVQQQKADWDIQQEAKKKRDEQERKVAEMMFGGIDPKDPATIERFTREVERLAAWNKVEHLGNGIFMVDYSTSGKLADDYAFPVIPRYALGEPMIHITRWDNGRLRVEAPAFRSDPAMSFSALMGAGTLAGGFTGAARNKMPVEPITTKGSFTLTTDARILANNSEDGPEESNTMQVIRWDVGPAAYGAPMALLKLAD